LVQSRQTTALGKARIALRRQIAALSSVVAQSWQIDSKIIVNDFNYAIGAVGYFPSRRSRHFIVIRRL
jgi:hypothetical protein